MCILLDVGYAHANLTETHGRDLAHRICALDAYNNAELHAPTRCVHTERNSPEIGPFSVGIVGGSVFDNPMTSNLSPMLQPCRQLIDVIPSSSTGDTYPLAGDGLEAAFVVPEIDSLVMGLDTDCGAFGYFLSHHTSRSPADLRRQVQRIYHALAREEQGVLYGALVDLFLTLEDKGRPLRTRMLSLAQHRLGAEQHRALYESLAQGLYVNNPIPVAVDSRLTKGVTGTCDLLERIAVTEHSEGDALAEARNAIEYGQLEQARELLEQEIMRSPEHQEVHEELLSIYLATRDLRGLEATRQRLEADTPFADEWEKAAETLGAKRHAPSAARC